MRKLRLFKLQSPIIVSGHFILVENSLYNKQKNTWELGNTRFIPRTHVLFSI